ncbi:MAG TPA: TetR/AcrR family transcriptional regulator C-terminal domain-containing protein [Bacillota bacterium]|nr:TetR/AcrR family transcriptional regulator C-terminal domain-containing protein [Bacillota bacterium]
MLYSGKPDITKKALAESLKACLYAKPLNKISVREVSENCGLNRQTFYYHFQDIYELLEWTIDHDVIYNIRDHGHFLTWQDAGVYLLHYIQKNEPLSLNILNSVGREALRRFYYKDAYSICTRFLKENMKGMECEEEDFQYLVHFYSISFASLLEDWVKTGMKRSPEKEIHALELVVSGTAWQAMSRFAEDRKSS